MGKPTVVRIGRFEDDDWPQVGADEVVIATPREICKHAKGTQWDPTFMVVNSVSWLSGQPYRTGYKCPKCGRTRSVFRDE